MDDHAPFPPVLVLGRDTCEDTTRSRAHLAERAIPYVYGNVEMDAGADAWNRSFNGGERVTPVILVGDPERPSSVLIEPSNDELDAALEAAPKTAAPPSAGSVAAEPQERLDRG